jgi:hypothetical protein
VIPEDLATEEPVTESAKRNPGTHKIYKKNAYLEGEKRKSLKLITNGTKNAIVQV